MNNEILAKLKDFWDKNSFLIVVIIAMIGLAYMSVVFLGKNNIVELEVEKALELETGLRVDLTP